MALSLSLVIFVWILFRAQNVVRSKVFVLGLVSVVVAVQKLLSLFADHGFPVLNKDFDDCI